MEKSTENLEQSPSDDERAGVPEELHATLKRFFTALWEHERGGTTDSEEMLDEVLKILVAQERQSIPFSPELVWLVDRFVSATIDTRDLFPISDDTATNQDAVAIHNGYALLLGKLLLGTDIGELYATPCTREALLTLDTAQMHRVASAAESVAYDRVRLETLHDEYPGAFDHITPEGMFIPERELLRIRASSSEDIEDRREAVHAWREEVLRQRKSIADAQGEIVDLFRHSPGQAAVASHIQILNLIGKEAKRGQWPATVIGKFTTGMQSAYERVAALDEAMQQYQTPEELFEACFGVAPTAPVRLVRAPLMLYLACESPVDYEAAYTWNSTDTTSLANDRRAARMSDGCAFASTKLASLKNSVCLQKGLSGKAPGINENTLTHEEQHVIHGMLEAPATYAYVQAARSECEEDARKILVTSLEGVRNRFALPQAKNEILAYLVEGRDAGECLELLGSPNAPDRLYNYYHKWAQSDVGKKSLEEWLAAIERTCDPSDDTPEARARIAQERYGEVVREVFGDEYRDILAEGVNVFTYLRDTLNMETESVVAHLTGEPLERWGKVAQRFGWLRSKDWHKRVPEHRDLSGRVYDECMSEIDARALDHGLTYADARAIGRRYIERKELLLDVAGTDRAEREDEFEGVWEFICEYMVERAKPSDRNLISMYFS